LMICWLGFVLTRSVDIQ